MKPFARVFVFSGLVFLPASIAVAQVKAGPEFRVNTYTTQAQLASDIAADPAGNFVVTWNSDPQDGSSWGVFAQRHAADGQRLGAEFRVNTYTTGLQVGPRVAVAERAYVVVWPNLPGVGSLEEIEGQRYSSDGSPLGGEFAVSEPGTARGPVGRLREGRLLHGGLGERWSELGCPWPFLSSERPAGRERVPRQYLRDRRSGVDRDREQWTRGFRRDLDERRSGRAPERKRGLRAAIRGRGADGQ